MVKTYRIPTSGSYITFPYQQDDKVIIKWVSGRAQQSAAYYAARCWWGNLSHPGDLCTNTNKFTVAGETIIFIAAEYIEEGYRSPTHLNSSRILHVRDRSEIYMQDKESTWALLRLDSDFHYGQDSKKAPRFRWLVYHPPFSTVQKPRDMFQHRFIDSPVKSFVSAVASAAAESGNDYLGAAGTVVGNASKLLGCVVGDYLHRFESPKIVQNSAMKDPAVLAALRQSNTSGALTVILQAYTKNDEDAIKESFKDSSNKFKLTENDMLTLIASTDKGTELLRQREEELEAVDDAQAIADGNEMHKLISDEIISENNVLDDQLFAQAVYIANTNVSRAVEVLQGTDKVLPDDLSDDRDLSVGTDSKQIGDHAGNVPNMTANTKNFQTSVRAKDGTHTKGGMHVEPGAHLGSQISMLENSNNMRNKKPKAASGPIAPQYPGADFGTGRFRPP